LGKQTSALGLKAASQVGSKVGGFVSDLKDNIASNLASATGTERYCVVHCPTFSEFSIVRRDAHC
jgi:hypothetical protein